MKIKFSFKDAVGMCISVVLLVIIFRTIRFDLFWSNFHTLNIWLLGLSMTIHIFQTYFLGWRWQMLFIEDTTGKKLNAVPSYFIGNFYNNLLPGRLGDIIKVYHFSRRQGIHYKNVLAGLILEKFIDIQVVTLFALLYVCFFPLPLDVLNWAVGGWVAFILLFDTMLLSAIAYGNVMKILLRGVPFFKIKIWLYHMFLHFSKKLKWLISSKKAGFFILMSFGFYMVGILCFYLNLKAIGLEKYFTDISTLLAFPAYFLIIHFIPSAPSSAGVVHYSIYKIFILIATARGIPVSVALENQILFSTVIFHLSYFIPETCFGFIFLIRERRALFHFKSNYF